MNEKWHKLLNNTLFVSPELVKKYFDHYGNAIVAPPTIRGNPSEYGVPHNSGYPILNDGQWYSLWGMRPARWAMSIAIGLKKGELEKSPFQNIETVNGLTLSNKWTVHHIYECGLPSLSIEEKAVRFSNLSNLVLMDDYFHKKENSFIHGEEDGALWLRWIIRQLYPEASGILNGEPIKPNDSPGLDQINVSKYSGKALKTLIEMRELEQAGNKPSTSRLKEAIAQGFYS